MESIFLFGDFSDDTEQQHTLIVVRYFSFVALRSVLDGFNDKGETREPKL
jgi:hypothetical protein